MITDDLVIKKPLEVSKELEIIIFAALRDVPQQSFLKDGFKRWLVNKLEVGKHKDDEQNVLDLPETRKGREKSQFRCFQKAMKILLVIGQCIGLNPVSSILNKDVSKIKFTIFSSTFIYTVIVAISQTVVLGFCFYMLFHTHISLISLANISFYFSIWCTTYIFIRIATKWTGLIKEILNCNLDEYVDVKVVRRVWTICIVALFLALLEHVLLIFSEIVQVHDCLSEDVDLYAELTKNTLPLLFDVGVTYNVPLGIALQFINTVGIINWIYSDLFIVCMSMYLTSILNQINKRIVWAADKNYLPPTIWGTLREDYTRATRLVRLFDNMFSGLVLVSFARNLFFVCLQFFNISVNGFLPTQVIIQKCPNFPSGPLLGYEYPLYLMFSLAFGFARFLTVSLVAAGVNVASLVPASALYMIPSCVYSKEVQRFLDQVNGDVVALSGWNFFYITRELVLSVAGTIVTYELVLLQFHNDEIKI